MVYIISDLHFGHDNIIKYEERPFSNAQEMDEEMIRRWNSVVNKNDKVFFLGDFGFGDEERIKYLVQRLHGYIVLIKGNHDKKSNQFYLDCGFNEVSKYPIIYQERFILSHKPVKDLTEDSPFYNLHGHKHSTCFDNPKYINMCVECWNYYPQKFDDIVKDL